MATFNIIGQSTSILDITFLNGEKCEVEEDQH